MRLDPRASRVAYGLRSKRSLPGLGQTTKPQSGWWFPRRTINRVRFRKCVGSKPHLIVLSRLPRKPLFMRVCEVFVFAPRRSYTDFIYFFARARAGEPL